MIKIVIDTNVFVSALNFGGTSSKVLNLENEGCREDSYLQELVRYIHLNPLRAKIVKDLNDLAGYSYCGNSALLGKVKREWHNVEYVLRIFGNRHR
ncbi:MAG: hypothetical protein ACMUIU_13405 [bacterium]